jgi:hypothetical protein
VERKEPIENCIRERKKKKKTLLGCVLKLKLSICCSGLSELASSAIQIYSFPCIEALVAHPTWLGYRLVTTVTFSVIVVASKLEVIRVINLLYHLSPQFSLIHNILLIYVHFYLIVLHHILEYELD